MDLGGQEAEILGRMKQKTRYNIGLAAKKGVTRPAGRHWHRPGAFVELMAATGARDGFGVHAPEYYRRAYALFQPAGQCELMLAEYKASPWRRDGFRPGAPRLVLLWRLVGPRTQSHGALFGPVGGHALGAKPTAR